MSCYLLDTNVILDLLLNRSPWADDAEIIWNAHVDGHIRAVMASVTATNIFYVVRRQENIKVARQDVQRCLDSLEIMPVDRSVLEEALALGINDFEDAVQIVCASRAGADRIVTRNPRDFAGSPILVMTPDVLAAYIKAQFGP